MALKKMKNPKKPVKKASATSRPASKVAPKKASKPQPKTLKTPAKLPKVVSKAVPKAVSKPTLRPGVKMAAMATASPKKAAVQAPIKPVTVKTVPVKPATGKGKSKPVLKGSASSRAAAAREEAEAHAEKDSQIEAFCPRCKTETTHKVSVMLGPKIRRVRCTVCGTEHNYHRSQLLKLRSVRDEIVQAKRRKEEESESKGLEKMYEEQMIGRDPKLAKTFSIKDKYYLEDLVNHPIFGAGLVTRIKEDGKIEVLFKSGLRLLVHNRFAATGAKKS